LHTLARKTQVLRHVKDVNYTPKRTPVCYCVWNTVKTQATKS